MYVLNKLAISVNVCSKFTTAFIYIFDETPWLNKRANNNDQGWCTAGRDTNRNIKRSVKFIRNLSIFIRIGSTPTILYSDSI